MAVRATFGARIHARFGARGGPAAASRRSSVAVAALWLGVQLCLEILELRFELTDTFLQLNSVLRDAAARLHPTGHGSDAAGDRKRPINGNGLGGSYLNAWLAQCDHNVLETLHNVLEHEPREAVKPNVADERPVQWRELGKRPKSGQESRAASREDERTEQLPPRAPLEARAARAGGENGEEVRERDFEVEHSLDLRVVERWQAELVEN